MENSRFRRLNFVKISQIKCFKPPENLFWGVFPHLKPIYELTITIFCRPICCWLSQLVQLSQLDQTRKVRTCHLLCRVSYRVATSWLSSFLTCRTLHTTPNTDRQFTHCTFYSLEGKKNKQLLYIKFPPSSLPHPMQEYYLLVFQMTVSVCVTKCLTVWSCR